MANKAVFIDRDGTILDDPGFLSDPAGVKLMPGVELALKSLIKAGYRIVVVTNQSGVARGLFTEETLGNIHSELRRQLDERGVHLDAVYYCPYHPEGVVEQYAVDSDLRKPRPGMLLKASSEMDLDLGASWMVGDSARDIEAGQRAGCRTIRIRGAGSEQPRDQQGEGVQADITVRNLVEAARAILHESPAEPLAEPAPSTRAPSPARKVEGMDDSEVRREILRQVRQFVREEGSEEFSFLKMLAGVVQVLALLGLINVLWRLIGSQQVGETIVWALVAVFLQLLALSLFMAHRNK